MSYTITTWDKDVFGIDDKNAEALIERWSNADSAFPVNLGEAAFSSSAIKSITKNKYTEADLPQKLGSKELRSDNRSPSEIYTAARGKAESVREILKSRGLKGLK